MAKVKMLTSANREGVAIPNGREADYPDDEAVSLVVNGLASPVGWSVVDGQVAVDGADDKKKKPAKAE
jgi:hypothetical protein